jgi:hypothetical protein
MGFPQNFDMLTYYKMEMEINISLFQVDKYFKDLLSFLT